MRDHRCQYTCDVCNASECHLYPKKTKHCPDCLRYCRSAYCFEMHKKPPPGQQFAQCDVTKYCPKCNRRHHVSGTNPKPHKCAADQCVQCGESLVTDGVHQCFIQRLRWRNHPTVIFLTLKLVMKMAGMWLILYVRLHLMVKNS